MSNIAIKAENISKYYRLGQINNGTLYQDIQSWFARKMGKEDPHSKIGGGSQCDKDGFWALKDVDFEIKQGDRVGIIGRNGSGKSTLLKVISEITTPTAGNIYIKGRIASLLEVGTGFHPEMTGRENIYMNGAILGMKKAEITRQLDEIIDFAEIEKYIDTPVKRYSSGMYVRLAFAVAAHLQSEILIADEVLAVGDAAFQKKALGKMNELSSGQGRTVLFVSHNMSQVRALCNKGIVLEKGTIVRQDNDIEKSIDYYLGKNDDNSDIETTRWENKNIIFDKSFNPICMEILDLENQLVTKNLDYDKDYKIRLTVSIEEPDLNINFFICGLKCGERYFVMSRPKVMKIKKGLNYIDFYLPKKTIFPNKYILSLGALKNNNTVWIVNPENCDVVIQTTIVSHSNSIFVSNFV